ncbi:MAG TPA: protein translocase subunit SecD [Acidimicrobiia bacterium]|nr:protein translocase subunit SecD [Acidimicrobiia bacterium]
MSGREKKSSTVEPSRISWWRLFFTVAVIGAAVYVILQEPLRLGLDLQGGTQIVLEAEDTADVTVDAEVTARTLEVLRRRVDALGVSEPTLQVSGDRRIIVELPGVDDPEQALDAIGRTAQLTFHPVVDAVPAGTAQPEEGQLVLPGEPGEDLVLGPTAVSGDQVESAGPLFDSQGSVQWVVTITFDGEGGDAWAALTADAACADPASPARRVAIVLDSQVISSPGVAFDVPCDVGITGGSTIITGGFTEQEATDLSLLIRAGALPVPVNVIQQSTVGPSLGESAIQASIEAAVIGAGLTVLYMIAYYRFMGMAAALSLMAYAGISYAVLAALGATLTLPGVAGFVLAVGMAVDANVLVYERAKEEHRTGLGVRDSITAGFKRAGTAIADSNITTLLAAMLLIFFASGAVRGFGVTVSVGVLVSLFSALIITRTLLELMNLSPRLESSPRAMGLTTGGRLNEWIETSKPDWLGNWKRWLVVSAVLVVVAISGVFISGVTFGVEFQGGELREFSSDQPFDLDEVRSALADEGLGEAVIQETGDGTVIVRTTAIDEATEEALAETMQALGENVEQVRSEFVGPTLGEELRSRALIALGIALLVQLIYLAIRFRWTIATAAVLAMAHDILILIGLFAWLGKTFDGVFLAALLTVIGYSVNDSVVIFDRIREERAKRPDDPIEVIANDACLHTIPRTINTGLGAIMILVSLFVLGGDTLSDFALALLIGILVGTYSSVFTASPIAIAFETRWPAPVREDDDRVRRPQQARAKR